jgi:hypothetical protein
MLSRQPELRPQSMREVVQDLRTASRGLRNIAAFSNEAGGSSPPSVTAEPVTMASPQPTHPSPPATPATYAQPQTAYMPPPAAYPPAYPPAYAQPAIAPGYPQAGVPYAQAVVDPAERRRKLTRIAEIAVIVLIMGGYALLNWQETMGYVHTFLQSLKPHL